MLVLNLTLNRRILTNVHRCPSPSFSSCTDAIRSSAAAGRHRHALSLYSLLLGSGHRPDPFSISSALKSCAHLNNKPLASSIHSQIIKLGHQSNVYTQTALLDLCSKLDGLDAARKLFDEMPIRNVVSWNAMLASYLRAGELASARRVFDSMPSRDVVTWNSMISGYAKAKQMDRARELFCSMEEPNAGSWNGIISGYIDIGDLENARKLFDEMPMRSNVSWIAMISGYARNGDVSDARILFDEMEFRDVFCWNAMISCYAQNGHPSEAIQLFNRMRKPDSGVIPDEMTLSSIISACSQLGELRFGSWVEEYMCCLDIRLDHHLSTALIDLYSKCGCMDQAFKHFGGLRKRDTVAYSAMILGCGVNGRSNDAVKTFNLMLQDEVVPNEITFIGLLTAYNHAGLIEEARVCFDLMWSKYNVLPSVDHYAIMVDSLGRSGRLDEAYGLVKKMPMEPHTGVWGALLLACRLHRNVELGEVAAENCFALEPEASGYYVHLANIYAEAGEWEKSRKVRRMMLEKGLSKMVACCWATS